jgi:methylphosphotriester-DNA--protein-cysteine methyltransferase
MEALRFNRKTTQSFPSSRRTNPNNGSQTKRNPVRTKVAIARAIEYIKNSWREGQSLKEIAAKYSLDPANLDREFRNSQDIPVKQYINAKRKQQVQKLIQHSNLDGYKIAKKIGMKDLAFYKWVKREFGESLAVLRDGKSKKEFR